MEVGSWIRRLRPSARSAVGAIGLDIGGAGLNAVQLEWRAGALRVRAAAQAARSGEAEALFADRSALRDFVSESLRAHGFRGRRVVAALTGADVKLMLLSYQIRAEGSDAEVILGLVGERVRDPIENLVIDYLPVRTGGERSALVAVAKRTAAIERLEALRACGFSVDALEIAPVALRRLMACITGNDPEKNAVVIQCGEERSAMQVLWGRRLILYRDLEFGTSAAVEAVAKALELPRDAAGRVLEGHGVGAVPGADPDPGQNISRALHDILKPSFYELSEQINKAVIYTASQTHGGTIDRVFLLGQPARWPGAADVLGELVELPASAVDPLAAFRDPDAPPSTAPWRLDPSLAAGLALRGLYPDECDE